MEKPRLYRLTFRASNNAGGTAWFRADLLIKPEAIQSVEIISPGRSRLGCISGRPLLDAGELLNQAGGEFGIELREL